MAFHSQVVALDGANMEAQSMNVAVVVVVVHIRPGLLVALGRTAVAAHASAAVHGRLPPRMARLPPPWAGGIETLTREMAGRHLVRIERTLLLHNEDRLSGSAKSLRLPAWCRSRSAAAACQRQGGVALIFRALGIIRSSSPSHSWSRSPEIWVASIVGLLKERCFLTTRSISWPTVQVVVSRVWGRRRIAADIALRIGLIEDAALEQEVALAARGPLVEKNTQ